MVYVYRGVTDMRMGFDRLAEKVKTECNRSVMQGGWYVFLSRSRDRVKIVYWDRDGYAMWMKRLEAGSFKVERHESGYEEVTSVDLEAILEGAELSRITLRKNVEERLRVS